MSTQTNVEAGFGLKYDERFCFAKLHYPAFYAFKIYFEYYKTASPEKLKECYKTIFMLNFNNSI